MAKTTRLRTATAATLQMDNPDIASGFEVVTVGAWLKAMMERQGIGNAELRNRLSADGYDVTQPAIANWRRNDSPLPLDKLPLILKCLDLSDLEVEHWVREIVAAYLPEEIQPWFKDPLQEKKNNVMGMLKRQSLLSALDEAQKAIEKAKSALQ